ncbi:hypothetical protein C8Q78DRAFT_1074611 [Trametes maxima]|nr:hypothetical protein C8Q78DRAFT_1074611 [Trametes maxima]
MVALSPRFALLAALSSLAAISLSPISAEAAAIQAQHEYKTDHFVVARHSSHGQEPEESSGRKYAKSPHKETKVTQSAKASSQKSLVDKPQRNAKPIVPLPARMAQKTEKASSKSPTTHGQKTASQKLKGKSKRTPWNPDPISRMEHLWEGGLARSLLATTDDDKTSHRNKRHHHHDHHDHHDHEKVVVSGDNDHVDVHERSVARDDADRIVVEGHDDHVHIHDHDRHDDHDRVLVKGDDDHVHVHRSPSPHHRHHHGDHHNEVEVKGNHDSVHVHRSPAPVPRHRHHEVIVKGDHDHVNVHRRVHSPNRHHTHKVIVKGDDQHVHVDHRRHHHHHHHRPSDKVVVKGDDDHVRIHKRAHLAGYPIVFSSDKGDTFVLHHAQSHANTSPDIHLSVNLRREDSMGGVPGSVEIMSPVANSTLGQRVASLVLASPAKNGTTSGTDTNPSFVLDASEVNSTQMYLVAASDVSPTSNSTSTNSTTEEPFVKVLLRTPVFDTAATSLKAYCATFDPSPSAPAPMTMESCNDPNSPNDEHKSQVFAYDPTTGAIRPMWFQGTDDGAGGGDSSSAATGPTGDSSGEDNGSGEDEGSDDDDGDASTNPTSGTNSTTVDPTTPASDKVASVTSFEDEALNQQFGDATRPPARLASSKAFAEEALSHATNVTLFFIPTAPEVAPATHPAEKVAEQPSHVNSTTSLADPYSTTGVTVSTASTTTSTASPSDSSGASSSSVDGSTSSSSATTAALEVKVYNPYAEATTLSTATVTSAETTTITSTVSSMVSTMTPVSTEPYEWMFKQRSNGDLD